MLQDIIHTWFQSAMLCEVQQYLFDVSKRPPNTEHGLCPICSLAVALPRFVQDAAEGYYDIIIVDSSDPVGPAEVLYQQVRTCDVAVISARAS